MSDVLIFNVSMIKKSEKEQKKKKYIEGIGRRKNALARVRIYPNEKKGFIVNEKEYREYFPFFYHQQTVFSPLQVLSLGDRCLISVKVKGGGKTGQAEAIRLGLSRAILKLDSKIVPKQTRQILKKYGFLTRDSRVVERKKYGFKKARRAPQWSKR